MVRPEPNDNKRSLNGLSRSLLAEAEVLAEAVLRMLLPERAYESITRDNRLLTMSRPIARGVLAWRSRNRPRTERTGAERLAEIIVINLAKRPDRLAQFDGEMARLNILDYSRFEAIEDDPGILGCTRSHAECIRGVAERSPGCVMVCEDDVEFLVSREELDVLVDAFLDDPQAEAACFAYHHVSPPSRYNSLFLRAPAPTLTTPCYLLKDSIAADVAECFAEGVQALAQGGDRMVFGLDIMWARLQQSRIFLIPIRRAARQRDGYSDIERRFVTYGGV